MYALRSLRAGALVVALALLPAAAQAETLRQALESAYVNNPDLMSALLGVKSSAENIALSKAGKLPKIGLQGTVQNNWTVTSGVSSTTPSYGLNLGYEQNLFDSYKTESEIEKARAGAELAEYMLRNEEQTVLLQVVAAYMSVIRDSQLVTLREETVAFYQAQLDSAKERLRLGEGTKIDVSQAETRLAAAVASYKAAIGSLQTSQATYHRWVGHKPKNLTNGFDISRLLPPSLDSAIASADERHPAILTTRAQIRAAMAGVDAARAGFGPKLGLTGSIGANGKGSADPVLSASVGLQLTIPLYAGGALGASMRKANIEQIKSEVDALSTRDLVRESAITAWSTVQTATAQIEAARSSVASGQLVVEGTIQERDVGQRTTLDVLNAQAELVTVREQLITATSQKTVAQFALLAAAGRLNPIDLNLDVEVKSGEAYTAKVEDIWQELRAVDE